VVSIKLGPLYLRKFTLSPTEEEVVWTPEPIWTALLKKESLAHLEFRTPDRPFRAQYQYFNINFSKMFVSLYTAA
jgi:hypothetical protein